jgi:dTDP-glucose 4,6-dehydratase
MRILVTGGAGFIGSNFVHYLLARYPDYEVVVLDKLTYAGNLGNLAPVSHLARFTFVRGDICDRVAVTQAMTGCDAVVNFAAETHVDRSIAHPEHFLVTNIQGTYVLLEVAKQLRVERFIQVSTDEVYGNAQSPEGVSRPSLETDTLMPLSPYAASKAGADRLAYSYWATYGLPVVITRCCNNYGPYQYPEKQLPLFILNALEDRPLPVYGDGRHSRDWIHVHDHACALDHLLHADAALVNGEIFNIGAGEERSILQNATAVLNTLKKSHELIRFVADRLGHVRRHAVDSSKLKRVVGWQPQIPFSDGLIQTIRWYRENAAWMESIKARGDDFLYQARHLGA